MGKSSWGRPIRVIETGEVFEDASYCAELIGLDQSAISRCLHGERSTHRGYHFKYAD